MDYKKILAVDVSKATLDYAIFSDGELKPIKVDQTKNKQQSICKLLSDLRSNCPTEQILVCFEATGIYSNQLLIECVNQGVPSWIVNAADVKKSIGDKRGKSDPVDAQRIGEYATRFIDRVHLVESSDIEAKMLKELSNKLGKLKREKASKTTAIREYKGRLPQRQFTATRKALGEVIKGLDKAIDLLTEEINNLIAENEEWNHQNKLIRTVTGVGPVLATTLLAETAGFRKFNTPRKLACQCGVAPFDFSSGTSLKLRPRVSHKANKRLKSLLHLAAMSAIQHDPWIRDYYLTKTGEGKAKMSVLNAVRNKILARVLAVIKNNSPYIALKH